MIKTRIREYIGSLTSFISISAAARSPIQHHRLGTSCPGPSSTEQQTRFIKRSSIRARSLIFFWTRLVLQTCGGARIEVSRAISGNIPRPRPIYITTSPREDYIVRPSRLHCGTSQFIDDTNRKQDSADSWRGLLGKSRTIGDLHFLLWYALPTRGMRLIYKFHIRSIRCNLLGIGHLCVRFFREQISQQDLIPKLDSRKGFPNRATAFLFVATVINFLLFSLSIGVQVYELNMFFREPLILDIGYPLSEARLEELFNNTLRNVNLISFWAGALPVSVKLPPQTGFHSSLVEIYISDFIVIWRAWVLFPDRQWVVLITFILWVGGAGK